MVLTGSAVMSRQHVPMHIRNRRLGLRDHRLGFRNHRLCIRNRHIGVDCQLGLKGEC